MKSPARTAAWILGTAFSLAVSGALAVALAVPALGSEQPVPQLAPPIQRKAAACDPNVTQACRATAKPSANEVVLRDVVQAPPPPCSPTLAAAPGPEMTEATTASDLPLAASGSLPAVMLFVDFPNRPATQETTRVHARLVPEARRWLEEVSYGRTRLEVTPIHRWYRMPRATNRYGIGDGLTFEEHRDYLADAVAAADGEVDFSRYKIVYVVAARGSALERSHAFHAHQGIGIAADGVEVRHAATFGEDVHGPLPPRYGPHVLVHETAHLLGLPDLYDGSKTTYPTVLRFAGGWDTMSWAEPGSHVVAWHKWKLGWLDPSELTCLDRPGELTATLSPLAVPGGLKAIVVPTGPSTAFVFEARKRVGRDARLCSDGVLVYTVDATVRTGRGPIRIRAAKADRKQALVERCGLLYDAPFDRGAGQVPHFHDHAAGLSLRVLGPTASGGYRVRVRRA